MSGPQDAADSSGQVGKFHVAGAIATLVAAAGFAYTSKMPLGGGGAADEGPDLAAMESIEASLAYKKPNAPKQPQKQHRDPVPVDQPDGVSHDENKVAIECYKPGTPAAKIQPGAKPCPEDHKKPDEDFQKLVDKYKRQDDPDLDPGKPDDPQLGQFDGSEFGFAEETKGDPYFQKLVGDLRAGWEYPTILNGSGVPVGCLRLDPDGRVVDTLFKEKSGDDGLDDSVQRALDTFKKERDKNPEQVPTNLLKAATTRWICFKFKL